MGTLLTAARLTTAVALPLLSACGGQVISAGDVAVLVSQRAAGGMDALGGGRIEPDSTSGRGPRWGCLTRGRWR